MTELDNRTTREKPLIETIERARNGDMVAFRSIVELHHDYFFGTAFRFLRNRDRAADVVQEAWIRIWKHLPSYRPEIKFTTWSYRIVIHLCLDTVRSDGRRRNVSAPLDLPEAANAASGGDDPDRSLDLRDLCDRILEASRTLPPKEQLVFQLRDVEDLSIEEIAGIMEISEGAVRANLCHARKRIRSMVGSSEGEAIS